MATKISTESVRFRNNRLSSGSLVGKTIPICIAANDLAGAGFAVHWLHPRSKRPIGDNWSDAPVATTEQLGSTYQRGNNLGVRLGEPSVVADGFLHVLDMDIRIADLADEAWDALRELFPDVDLDALPCVASGSGGESRHLYLIADKAFRSKTLAHSEGKHRRTKPDGSFTWSWDWEIELFGTGKQVVLPPSIHPDTRQPYRWLREFEFDLLDFGMGPFLPSAAIERLAVAEHAIYEFETREPLTFTPEQLHRTLGAIPVSDLDYDDWIRLGQALHHQFGGSEEGFALWVEHTKRSKKFTGEKQLREMRRVKWKSFGRYRGKPVTMATIVEWAKDARVADLRASFDDEDDDEEGAGSEPVSGQKPSDRSGLARPVNDEVGTTTFGTRSLAPAAVTDIAEVDPVDAIGGVVPQFETMAPSATAAFDEILGGDDDDTADEAEEPEDEVDDIDAIGSNVPVKGQTRGVAGDWISLLDINDEGAIKPSLHNVELIVTNDPRLVGLPQLNEFTQETVQRTAPGRRANQRRNAAKQARQLEGRVWQVRDELNGELWSDDRDFAIRSILEAPGTQGGYGIKVTDRDLKASIVLAANGNAFHPVREYLEGLTWDGVTRAENLFRDHVGAPDDAYSRSVSRLMLIAAVTRIFEPGHKFDFAVILEGLQGKRKSTFIQTLGKSWFAELDGDFHDPKQMIELMQNAWIMEIPELSGFNRGDVRSIKAFISRQRDRARLAYARRAGEFPRQCIFIGSTNDKEYLKDDTGGRRFWPMLCTAGEIDIAGLERNVDQIWAEALVLYRAMRTSQPHGILPLYLADDEAKITAARLQESRRVETSDDIMAGRIAEWLSSPVVTGSMDDDFEEDGAPRYRTETCLVEIWTQCLGNDARALKQAESQGLGRAMRLVPDWSLCTIGTGRKRFGALGQQRFYSKFGDEGFLKRSGQWLPEMA